MAKLKIFARKLPVSSDDLVIPYTLRLITKIVLIALGSYTLSLYDANPTRECGASDIRREVMFGVIVMSASAVCDALLAAFSYRGTMDDDRPRRHIGKLLYLSAILLIADCAYSLGFPISYTMSKSLAKSDCIEAKAARLTGLLSALKLLSDAAWASVLCTVLISSRSKSGLNNPTGIQIWRRRFEKMYGLKEAENKGSIQQPYLGDVLQYLSVVLSEVTSGLDLTASDLMAGIILIVQRKYRNRLTMTVSDEESEDDLSTLKPPIASLGEIIHLFEFAEMTYGAPERAARSICRFIMRIMCPSFLMPKNYGSLDEADFSTLPSPVLLSVGEVNPDGRLAGKSCRPPPELIFCSVNNSLFMVPFVILCDNCYKTVVIAIRGTLSIRDFFVDLYTDAVPLRFRSASNSPNLYYAHSGFMRCALNVREKLISSRVLNILFSAGSKYENYSLTCIGHSLGAAVATLLAYLLREEHPELPPARCIAYSPPCAVMSPKAADAVKDYVLSVVIGNDIISRLTKESIVDLLSEIEAALRNSRQKKVNVLWRYMFFGKLNIEESGGNVRRTGALPIQGNDLNSEEESIIQSGEPSQKIIYPRAQPKTVLAGRILHVIPRRSCATDGKTIEAKCDITWKKKEDFYDIIINSTTFNTHIPRYAMRYLNPAAIVSYPKELGEL